MLLNYNNQHKMLKGVAYGWRTAVLHLAPYKLSSRNVCPSASRECIKACLNTAGRGQQNNVQRARLRKTEYFHKNRSGFIRQLANEIEVLKKRSKKAGYKFAVRLNGTSDLSFERFRLLDGQSLMDAHPDVQFYDYTKVYNRLTRDINNYYMIFSYSGRNKIYCMEALHRGYNVAVVFGQKLPSRFWRHKVFDGDNHDLRFTDPGHRIIGLRAKGRARKEQNEFVNDI